MRTLKFSLLAALITLVSCGQKGPLYIEDSLPTTPAPEVSEQLPSVTTPADKNDSDVSPTQQ